MNRPDQVRGKSLRGRNVEEVQVFLFFFVNLGMTLMMEPFMHFDLGKYVKAQENLEARLARPLQALSIPKQ